MAIARTNVKSANADKSAARKQSRRPPNTAFRQQRLKAWQPILTPRSVLPLFFVLGIIIGPLGGGLLYLGQKPQQMVIDYTECEFQAGSSYSQIPKNLVHLNLKKPKGAPVPASPEWKLGKNENDEPVCFLRVTIPSDISPPVFLYYRLSNFYQNHRKYVRSYSEDQIKGKVVTASEVTGDDKCGSIAVAPNGKVYYPCGLIANSLFNDTFSNFVNVDDKSVFIMTNKGIAWSTDISRFRKTKYKADQIEPPPNWRKRFPNGYSDDNIPDLHEWQELMVWMRTAALLTFSKLAKKNDNDTLKAGTYEIEIVSNFPIKAVEGKKSIVISQTTIIGGRNIFLGVAYIAVGGSAILLGLIFLIRHIIKPRKLGDHKYLTWNTDESITSRSREGSNDDYYMSR